MNSVRRPWVIVLAGGSGERLRAVTSTSAGQPVPKQFCRLNGRHSMLAMTLARARDLTSTNRILLLVRKEHRPWWNSETAGLRPSNVLVLSRNRGTGLAVLRALLHVEERDPDACVVVLPSDHAVDDEGVLRRAILQAVEEAHRSERSAVLVGAPADTADPSMGWILPGRADAGRARSVASFVEKPGIEEAASYLRRDALRNTLILAGRTRALLDMYAAQTVDLAEVPGGNRRSGGSTARKMSTIYPHLPTLDLSRDILQGSSHCLRVLSLPECGWTDIGTLDRLEAWWMSHSNALERVRQSGVLPVEASRFRRAPAPSEVMKDELVVTAGSDRR